MTKEKFPAVHSTLLRHCISAQLRDSRVAFRKLGSNKAIVTGARTTADEETELPADLFGISNASVQLLENIDVTEFKFSSDDEDDQENYKY